MRYAAALYAQKILTSSVTVAIINNVNSEDEAVGRAQKFCLKHYPASQGYMQHTVEVLLIPDQENTNEHV
jgi:hypothetical protein